MYDDDTAFSHQQSLLLTSPWPLRKTDTVATLLATKAVYATLEQVCDQILELRRDVAKATGDENIGASKPLKSIFDIN